MNQKAKEKPQGVVVLECLDWCVRMNDWMLKSKLGKLIQKQCKKNERISYAKENKG